MEINPIEFIFQAQNENLFWFYCFEKFQILGAPTVCIQSPIYHLNLVIIAESPVISLKIEDCSDREP